MIFGFFFSIRRIRWRVASQFLELDDLVGTKWVVHFGRFRNQPVARVFELVTVTAGVDDVLHWSIWVGDVEHYGKTPLREGDKFVLAYSSTADFADLGETRRRRAVRSAS